MHWMGVAHNQIIVRRRMGRYQSSCPGTALPCCARGERGRGGVRARDGAARSATRAHCRQWRGPSVSRRRQPPLSLRRADNKNSRRPATARPCPAATHTARCCGHTHTRTYKQTHTSRGSGSHPNTTGFVLVLIVSGSYNLV